MKKPAPLNKLYADYSAGLLHKKDLESAVFRAIQKDIRLYCLSGLSMQDRDDYISWLYPRIRQAIINYRDTGSSFETYIGAMVRLTVKEYRVRQARSYAAESAVYLMHSTSGQVCEPEPRYNDSAAVTVTKRLEYKSPRQLLILVLKCSSYVSIDFLERVSPMLGVDIVTLYAMIDKLKKLRIKREREIERLRERVNCQFFRCILKEHIIRSMPENSAAAQKCKEQLERGRVRLENSRNRLAKLRPDPSNGQIAKILGVSRGTVDAALHHLKIRQHMLDKHTLDKHTLN